MQTLFNYQIYLTLWDAHMYFFFSYPYSSVCIWKMQEKESLLANLRLTTSQATSNQTAAVYTSPVPTEGGINLEGLVLDRTRHLSFLTGQDLTPKFAGPD